MNIIFFFPIIFGAVAWVVMLISLLQARNHANDRKNHPENYVYRDVSDSAPELPKQAQKMAAQLEQLGFHHIGTIQRGPGDKPHNEWVYLDQTATVVTTLEPLGGRYAVSGAQAPEILADAIRQAMAAPGTSEPAPGPAS